MVNKRPIPKRAGLFSSDQITQAIANDTMLSIALNTSPVCTLGCLYCFNEKCNPKDTMDITTRKRVIDEVVELGAKEIVICGKGEPLEDPDIDETIKYIFSKGLRLELFTNGINFEERHIRWFKETEDSCITIKYLSSNPKIQDYLAGMTGYHDILAPKIEALKTAGFNEGQISLSTQVTTLNIGELPDIYRMCRHHGFIPHFARLLSKGRAEDHPELFCTEEEIQSLTEELRKIDESLGYDCENFNPIFGHHKCRFIYYSPYVEYDGIVYPCIGRTRTIGSLKERSFSSIWSEINSTYKSMPEKMSGYCAGCKSLKEFKCYGCIRENQNTYGNEFSSVERSCPSCFTGRDVMS